MKHQGKARVQGKVNATRPQPRTAMSTQPAAADDDDDDLPPSSDDEDTPVNKAAPKAPAQASAPVPAIAHLPAASQLPALASPRASQPVVARNQTSGDERPAPQTPSTIPSSPPPQPATIAQQVGSVTTSGATSSVLGAEPATNTPSDRPAASQASIPTIMSSEGVATASSAVLESGILGHTQQFHAELANFEQLDAFFVSRDGASFGLGKDFVDSIKLDSRDSVAAFNAFAVVSFYIGISEALIDALVSSSSFLPVVLKAGMTYSMYYGLYWAFVHSANKEIALGALVFTASLAASELIKSSAVNAGYATLFFSAFYVIKGSILMLMFISALKLYQQIVARATATTPSAMV